MKRSLPLKLPVFTKNKGFTLIELLVVFVLMAIVSGIGFASFSDYSKKQTLIQAANNFKESINLAKFNAISSVKPASCPDSSFLNGYKLIVCAKATCKGQGSPDYEIDMTCDGVDTPVQSRTFPNGVTLDASTTCAVLDFKTVSGTLSGGSCSITLKGFNKTSLLNVDLIGNVSQ